MTDPAFAGYDLDYLSPPEPDERTAEEREDAEYAEADRAYDEMRDRQGEERGDED